MYISTSDAYIRNIRATNADESIDNRVLVREVLAAVTDLSGYSPQAEEEAVAGDLGAEDGAAARAAAMAAGPHQGQMGTADMVGGCFRSDVGVGVT